MSESLRDLLRQGADTVERPQVPMDELVAITERRLVRRRLAVVAASAAAAVLVAAGGFALRPDDERLAPAPPAPTETEHPPGPPRDRVFGDAERYVAVPPGLYAVPFSGWGDLPPEVADLRAVVELSCRSHEPPSQHLCRGPRAADPRELGFWTVDKVPNDFCRSQVPRLSRIPVPRWRTWRPPWPPSRGSAARIPVR